MLKSIFLSLSVFILCTSGPIKTFSPQENSPPIVKILDPLNKSKCDLNTQVYYRIKVSDLEDGESEYGEIAGNEVFLEVRYLPDASKVSRAAIPAADPKGLAIMKKSNCFNCHAFNGKLIAPSYYEITKRYSQTSYNTDLLAKRIREGSQGVWGTASMPTHGELTDQEAHEIVSWILENAEDPNLNYYTGPEGTFRTKARDGAGQSGVFILSATYSDHGAKNSPQQNLSSKDEIVLYVK